LATRAFLPSDAWEDKVSDKPSADTGAGGSAFQAAKDAVTSAAEQVRASAPGAYEASMKAGHYVGEAAADHPLTTLLVTATVAFLAGYASHTRGEDDRRGWRNRTGDWQKRGYELSERARAAAPAVSQAATDAGQYVAKNAREHPIPGAIIAGSIVCVLGYLLFRRD
jgi:ElaB/YqjD/DUF883 family membrane-anchored ribosome-binding protein